MARSRLFKGKRWYRARIIPYREESIKKNMGKPPLRRITLAEIHGG